MLDRSELAQRLIQLAYIHGDFTLRSGRKADTYFDKFLFMADPECLAAITATFITRLPERFDHLAGLELGGVPLASTLSLQCCKPLNLIRKSRKSYGTCKIIEGPTVANKEIILIEDVVSTGGAIIEAAEHLKQAQAKVIAAFAVVSRNDQAKHNLLAHGIAFDALFDYRELKDLIDEADS